ncbi:MAG: hypothetical protein V1738_05610 [Patescibacteria group bacterium]
MDKKTIIVVMAGLLGVALIISLLVVLNSRQQNPATGLNQPSVNQPAVGVPDNQVEPIVGGGPQGIFCGNGLCDGTETIESCFSDCLPKDIIQNVRTTSITSEGRTVSWTTTAQSTSRIQYGQTDQYELGAVEDAKLTNEHSLFLPATAAGLYFMKVGGADAQGQEYYLEGFQFEL